jgi:hypothetical protein
MAAAVAGALSASSIGELGIVLTRKQLQAFLLDMINSDEEFVSALHRRYLETVTRRAMTQ